MNKHLHQYQHLHLFLDEQLKAAIGREKEPTTFDRLEEKLKSIEDKLRKIKNSNFESDKNYLGLQNSDLKNSKISRGVGSFVVEQGFSYGKESSASKKHIENSANNPHPNIKQSVLLQKRDQSVDDWTPAKKLQIVPNTMSADHLYRTAEKTTVKKTKKRKAESKKKKNQMMQSVRELYRPHSRKHCLTPKKEKNNFSQMYSSSAIQIRVLKKQLNQCQKSNTQLRRKMNELKSYEDECGKLKQIFDRCEQIRRQNRLNKVHKF